MTVYGSFRRPIDCANFLSLFAYLFLVGGSRIVYSPFSCFCFVRNFERICIFLCAVQLRWVGRLEISLHSTLL